MFISLAYWEGIDFYGYSVCCGTPQAIGSFLCNKIDDHTGELQVNSFGGFVLIQCSWIALISLFLSRVWGHVFLVVSDRSKFFLSLSIYLLFISFSSCTRVLSSQSRVHVVFTGISMYIRENRSKNRMYTQLWSKKSRTRRKRDKKKVNRQAETKFTPIKHYQENMPLDLTQKQRNQSITRTLNVNKTPKRND